MTHLDSNKRVKLTFESDGSGQDDSSFEQELIVIPENNSEDSLKTDKSFDQMNFKMVKRKKTNWDMKI
jgi:hypothetical protein